MALLKELLKKIRGENEPDDYSEPPVSEPVEKPAEAPASPAPKPVPPVADPAAVYRKIRSQALGAAPPVAVRTEGEPPFYSAVIDIASAEGCTTMVCRYPEEVNLYTRRGDVMMGVQKNAPEVEEAAGLLWKVMGHFASQIAFMKDEDYQLPGAGKHRVFLLARDGIGRLDIDPTAPYESGSMERTVLYAYYHLFRCIAKCREEHEAPVQPDESAAPAEPAEPEQDEQA